MVEKIPVRPESVRGLGNIISPAKTLEDFSVFNSRLSYVDGLYTMEYTFISVTLTSDKSILSYADGDSATLTATVLEDSSAVSGETVEFYRYVDGTNDVLLGSDVTDSNGEAIYSYASAGIGDVELYAKVRTFVSKTYSIEDCNYYNVNSISSTTTLNIQLPSDFEISYKITGTTGKTVWLELGDNSSNSGLIGQIGSSGITSFRCGGADHTNTNVVANQETIFTTIKNGSDYSFSKNNDIITFTDSTTTHQLLKRVVMNATYPVRELKVKPL